MPGRSTASPDLDMYQIKTDLFFAETGLKEAETVTGKVLKYLKGGIGYHLQQAAEKLIKIQIYRSGANLNHARLYKHNLQELIDYANEIGVALVLPGYIERNAYMISDWEATGRYDVHVVVRIDTLKKAYAEIKNWFSALE